MTTVNFTPSPGIVLVEEIKHDTSTGVQTQLKSNNRTVKGRVIEVGPALVTDMNATLEPNKYAHNGDVVYFLSYEGNYDIITISGKDYYVVKFQDLRGVLVG